VTYPAYLDTSSGLGTRSLAPSDVLAAYEARRGEPTTPSARFTAPDIEDAYGLALRARMLGSRD
jgi:hypothetical protein